MAELHKLVIGYKDKMEKIARASVLELSNRVVFRTPVDTGYARLNWHPSVGSISKSRLSDEIQSVISNFKTGKTYYMTNNVPYIRRLEYEGWSAQAPNGMLGVSVNEWPSIVRQATRAVR